MIEHCLLFLVLFFQVSLKFFLCRDQRGKESSYIFCLSAFDDTFGRHQVLKQNVKMFQPTKSKQNMTNN